MPRWWHQQHVEFNGSDLCKGTRSVPRSAVTKRASGVSSGMLVAVVGAVTAIELVTRYMLVRPLLRGAFLSDSWAKILAKHITQGRLAREHDLLPSMLGMYDIKIDDFKLSDGSSYRQYAFCSR
jgi:hypothetical protein